MKLGSHLTAGYDFTTAYAASKFGLEGWMAFTAGGGGALGINTTCTVAEPSPVLRHGRAWCL